MIFMQYLIIWFILLLWLPFFMKCAPSSPSYNGQSFRINYLHFCSFQNSICSHNLTIITFLLLNLSQYFSFIWNLSLQIALILLKRNDHVLDICVLFKSNSASIKEQATCDQMSWLFKILNLLPAPIPLAYSSVQSKCK